MTPSRVAEGSVVESHRFVEPASHALGLLPVSTEGPLSLARAVGRAVRDWRFERSAQLATLPHWLLAALLRHPITLPPPMVFSPGNQNVTGLIILVALAKTIGAKRILEIGSYNGVTALTLARNLPEAEIHTLDLPPGEEATLPLFRWDAVHIEREAARAYKGENEEARIVQHFGDSATFNFSSFGRSVDLVYIDGAHSQEYVVNDTKIAFQIVSDFGAVVWDDYWRHVPAVPAYLNYLCAPNLYRLPGTRLAVSLSHALYERLRCAQLQELPQ